MPLISIDLDMERVTNDAFIEKAKACEPGQKEKIIRPAAIVEIEKNGKDYPDVKVTDVPEHLPDYHMAKGDKVCLDFGHHQVGYVTLKLSSVGSPQDAPAYFRLKFGEIAKEMIENSAEYDGWISRGWIQEEFIHVDVLPVTLKLPRRYAFRFLEIETIDTSLKWRLVVDDVVCRSVSAVDMADVEPLENEDEVLKAMDDASLRTLQNCMQSVFEDGPKRDRRLWIGDLRLQALANYATFKNYDLVKRCLYLFAGLTRGDGRVGACLFIEPEYMVDDTFLTDYSLFFVPILLDYYEETKDWDVLKELACCAYRQLELTRELYFEDALLVGDGKTPDMGLFIDWKEGLNKQAAGQAVYIYCAKRMLRIAEILGDTEMVEFYHADIESKTAAALKYFWDEEQGMFVSGESRQISYASQVWMILAEVIDAKKGGQVLNKLMEMKPEMGMVSPYMNHHFVEALLMCGRKKEALEYMKYYWGGMLELGADTFWELYNPENPAESPYGSSIVNSYCHAWSCTPAYLLRKYEL